mmetsp:Transcript_2865/g.5254  ORF Transcript_2865/g.5254 Transcript_2865/m.5254 type:complete len:355 (+) Transcript_2865:287-1351(+)
MRSSLAAARCSIAAICCWSCDRAPRQRHRTATRTAEPPPHRADGLPLVVQRSQPCALAFLWRQPRVPHLVSGDVQHLVAVDHLCGDGSGLSQPLQHPLAHAPPAQRSRPVPRPRRAQDLRRAADAHRGHALRRRRGDGGDFWLEEVHGAAVDDKGPEHDEQTQHREDPEPPDHILHCQLPPLLRSCRAHVSLAKQGEGGGSWARGFTLCVGARDVLFAEEVLGVGLLHESVVVHLGHDGAQHLVQERRAVHRRVAPHRKPAASGPEGTARVEHVAVGVEGALHAHRLPLEHRHQHRVARPAPHRLEVVRAPLQRRRALEEVRVLALQALEDLVIEVGNAQPGAQPFRVRQRLDW